MISSSLPAVGNGNDMEIHGCFAQDHFQSTSACLPDCLHTLPQSSTSIIPSAPAQSIIATQYSWHSKSSATTTPQSCINRKQGSTQQELKERRERKSTLLLQKSRVTQYTKQSCTPNTAMCKPRFCQLPRHSACPRLCDFSHTLK
jgi:hypothetical protein